MPLLEPRSGGTMGPVIFQPAARYPADPRAVFILALSIFAGATALAVEAAPETLNAILPKWGVILWAILLSLGSVVALVGMVFQTLNGIIAEQIGSVMVGVTTVFYSTLAFWTVGFDALQPVGVILAWGLSCFVRWVQLQLLIRTAYRRKLKNEARQIVEDAILRSKDQ